MVKANIIWIIFKSDLGDPKVLVNERFTLG